jgi:hypothetical protein
MHTESTRLSVRVSKNAPTAHHPFNKYTAEVIIWRVSSWNGQFVAACGCWWKNSIIRDGEGLRPPGGILSAPVAKVRISLRGIVVSMSPALLEPTFGYHYDEFNAYTEKNPATFVHEIQEIRICLIFLLSGLWESWIVVSDRSSTMSWILCYELLLMHNHNIKLQI